MADDICEWLTQGRLPEFASLPDMFKESQIDQCKIWCPDHACSFAEQYKNPEQVCPEQVCPELVCPEQVCQEKVCPEKVCPEQTCPEHARSFAEQDRAFNQLTISHQPYYSDFPESF